MWLPCDTAVVSVMPSPILSNLFHTNSFIIVNERRSGCGDPCSSSYRGCTMRRTQARHAAVAGPLSVQRGAISARHSHATGVSVTAPDTDIPVPHEVAPEAQASAASAVAPPVAVAADMEDILRERDACGVSDVLAPLACGDAAHFHAALLLPLPLPCHAHTCAGLCPDPAPAGRLHRKPQEHQEPYYRGAGEPFRRWNSSAALLCSMSAHMVQQQHRLIWGWGSFLPRACNMRIRATPLNL